MKFFFTVFLLVFFLAGCSKTQHILTPKSLVTRKLASETSRGWKQCYLWKKKACANRFPFQSVKRKWHEFEYQYLNRRNEVHVKHNQCIIEAGSYCSGKFQQMETADDFNRIRGELQLTRDLQEIAENDLWNNISIPGIELTSEKIKQIWQFITRMKAIYSELGHEMIQQGHEVQENSLDALHGFGLSLSGSAFAGLGVEVRHEAVMHNGKMAVFCAPGIITLSDVGVTLDLSLVKTLGCKSNEHYKGKFLSLQFGASAETLGLPVSGSVSYSLGVNLTEYLRSLADLKKKGKFSTREMVRELMNVSRMSTPELVSNIGDPREAWGLLFIGQFLSRSIEEKELSLEFNQKLSELEEEKIEFEKIESLSHLLRLMVREKMKSRIFKDGRNPNLHTALFELVRQMSNCDAVNASIGLSLTALPVSAGFSMHHYHQVTEVDMRDVLYLATFGPRTLATLQLGAEEMKKFKDSLLRTAQIIPDHLTNTCLRESSQKFYLDGKNIIELLKED